MAEHILCAHDRFTKAMHVVPTVQNGGQNLPSLMWICHQAVRLRCDNEPGCPRFIGCCAWINP